MASSLILTIKSDESQSLLQQLLQLSSTKDREVALALSRYFKDMASHRSRGVIDVQTGASAPVAASGTLTLSSMAGDETCVIGSETFTAKSSPSGDNQFEIDGDDTADAAALAVKINAHPTLSKVVSASSSSGVVTIVALQKGVVGNEIKLTGDTGCTASAAYLANGAGGVEESGSTFYLGLS